MCDDKQQAKKLRCEYDSTPRPKSVPHSEPLSEKIVREPLGMDSKTWPQGNTANLPSFSPEKPLPILKGDCVKNRCPDLYGIMIY